MQISNSPLETLTNLQFNIFADSVPLWPLAILIALLLGHVFYTDYFKGHKISNTTSMGFATLGFTAALFLYSNLSTHMIFAGVFIAFLLILFIFADFGGGDLKIYSGMALLLGPAVIILMVIASVFTLIFNIPMMINNRRQHKQDKKPGRAKLGRAPLGPGIAIAFPVVLFILGLSLVQSAIFLAAILLSIVYYYYDDKITQKALSDTEVDQTEDEAESSDQINSSS